MGLLDVSRQLSAIAISYRRQDTRWAAGRIRDHLALAFGSEAVFEDVVSIPLGVDFRAHIGGVIAQARVVLVLIGSEWLDAKLETGERRLDIESDHVRLEVEAALASEARVIPVLIDAVEMPSSAKLPKSLEQLAFLNGIRVRPDPDFKKDLGTLITAIRGAMEGIARPSREERLVEVQPDANSRVKTIDLLSMRDRSPAALVHLYGPHRGRIDSLVPGNVEAEGLVIGRSDTADLRINSEAVSRHHARVTTSGIKDLGSTNGTMVNDLSVSSLRLHPGDQIYIGGTLLEFVGGANYGPQLTALMEQLPARDGLTALGNRPALVRFITQTAGPIAVLAFHVERLEELHKNEGDTGLDYADRCVARALSATIIRHGLFARLGGGRFALAVPELTVQEANELGAQLTATTQIVVEFEDFKFPVVLGVGIIRSPGPHDADALIGEATARVSMSAPTGQHRALRPSDE